MAFLTIEVAKRIGVVGGVSVGLVGDVIECLCICVPNVCVLNRGRRTWIPQASPSSGGICSK